MEPLEKLTVKLKSHVWCLIFFSALLIFWITAFSVSGKGGDIASWLSILFAVVVIVYMLIQGYEMRNLVEEGHQLMAEKADTMVDKADKVAEESKSMHQRMSDFFKAYEGLPSPKTPTELSETSKFSFDASDLPIVHLLFLYAAIQSSKFNKPIFTKKIITGIGPLPEGSQEAFTKGVLIRIASFAAGLLCGLQCFLAPNSVGLGKGILEVQVKNLPSVLEKQILKELNRRAAEPPVSLGYPEFIESSKQSIDAYFAEL